MAENKKSKTTKKTEEKDKKIKKVAKKVTKTVKKKAVKPKIAQKTAKKTVKKKVVTQKSKTQKKSLKTKTVTKKGNKSCSKFQKTIGGFFAMFSSTLNKAFNDFKELWWRISIINFCMLFMLFLGVCLSILLFIVLLGFNQVMGDVSGTSSGFLGLKSMGGILIAFLLGLGSVFTWGTEILKKVSVVILGIITIGFSLYISFWGDFKGGADVLESFIANITYGGFLTPWQWGSFMITLFTLITWIFFWGTLSKIASWQVTKSVAEKKPQNPLKTYFLDSWSFFWRFIGLSVKVFLYVCGPLFLWLMVGLLGSLLLAFSGVKPTDGVIIALNIITILYVLGFFLILINRSVKMVFAQTLLITQNKTSKEAKEGSLNLVSENFWKVLFSLIIIMGIYFIFVQLLKLPEIMGMEVSRVTEKVLVLFDIILSFIIFPPIMFSFTYRLMNFLKSQKGK